MSFLQKAGVRITNGYSLPLTFFLSLEQLGWLKDFPHLDISVVSDQQIRIHQLVGELPSLSQCSSENEFDKIKDIACLTDVEKSGNCRRYKKFTEAFPKLKSHLGFLLGGLKGLSDQKADEVITFMKGKEPFVNLTSGAMMGYFINKVADGNDDFPFKQFSAAFPNLVTNFAAVGNLVTLLQNSGWDKTTLELFPKYGLDKLEISNGYDVADIINAHSIEGVSSMNQIEPRFKLFADCVKAFPLIREYGSLAKEICELNDEQRNTLELFMADGPVLPFQVRVNYIV